MSRQTSTRRRALRASLLLTALALGTGAAPLFDSTWRKSDHDRMGKTVGAYFEAKDEEKGINEAWEDLTSAIEKLEKKYPTPLAHVEDWERVFRSEMMAKYKERPRKGKVLEDTLSFARRQIEVAMVFPDKYATKGDPYPLFLVAAEPGQKPAEALEQWSNADLRQQAIVCAVQMPSNTELLTVAVGGDDPSGLTLLMSAFATTKNVYAVDMDRVFLAGHGDSIAAAGLTAAAFPHLFAGLVARGVGSADVPVQNFRGLPSLWLAAGEGGTAFEEAAKGAGLENVTVSGGASDDEILAWMGDKQRDPYPTHVTFAPASAQTLATSWISLRGASPEDGSTLEAKVDRETNTVTIDTENVVSINLFLNDVLVDLDQPVKVILNGRLEEAMMARNQRTMVELIYGQGDWGRVFTASGTYNVEE